MSQPFVLVAEETPSLCDLWIGILRDAGIEALVYAGNRLPEGRLPAAFVAGAGCGEQVLFGMRAQGVPVIFVAHASSEQLAINALRAGCAEYLVMPVRGPDLVAAVDRFCSRQQQATGDGMVGDSATMQNLRLQLKRVAKVRSNVLITGETGTGKELVAQSIHRQSERKSQQFVCVNCAAIPDSLVESELFGYERGAFTGAVASRAGKLQAAEAGTIFLDEVGDMSLTAQAKILRAIETRELYRLGAHVAIPVNVRILAATHRNLEKMAEAGQFRSDLLYRLSVTRVHLAPLRDRREDIKPIARHCMQQLNRELDTQVENLSEDLWERFMNYSWPGNIRELRNMMESLLVQSLSKIVTLEDLPADLRDKLGERVPEGERDRLLTALMETKWNKSKAAERLKWSRMTLYRKMMKYSVHP